MRLILFLSFTKCFNWFLKVNQLLIPTVAGNSFYGTTGSEKSCRNLNCVYWSLLFHKEMPRTVILLCVLTIKQRRNRKELATAGIILVFDTRKSYRFKRLLTIRRVPGFNIQALILSEVSTCNSNDNLFTTKIRATQNVLELRN